MYEKNNRTIQRCLPSVCPKWQPTELRKLVIFERPLFWTVLNLYQSFASKRPLKLFITERGFRLQTLTCPHQLIFLRKGAGEGYFRQVHKNSLLLRIIHRSQKYIYIFAKLHRMCFTHSNFCLHLLLYKLCKCIQAFTIDKYERWLFCYSMGQ